ncbi:DUF4386 domain-containing protein [Cognatishimia sp. F0-27]|uniref:DUF4386 domain-containing protein n=1 Tax=Cognatishimia sp. F0-27 TaxID=2816855 RepID=UPI001D0CC5D4|nr:DUF4386 domain-containing protein [Cognatishimia sp. F0-27]MCC1492048.1 DUF4386 domain-containing protein [Cognatishimia sp. F0-27]
MQGFSDPLSSPFARWTGFFYLGIAIAGGFSIAYVPSQIVVAGDATATVSNITSRTGLYHAGIAGDLVVMVFELFAVAMLYAMFRDVSRTLSLAAALARLSMVSVMSAMLFFHAGAELLAQSDSVMQSFTMEQRADVAGLFLEMHRAGVWIWQVFFTLHLVLLGSLVVKSGRFPAVLGYGLMLGASGYLLDSLYAFAFPETVWLGWLRAGLLAVVTVSEIGFALWLLIRAPGASAKLQRAVS